MNESKLVSVLLPVYNGASFIEKAVSSIQRQIYRNWELIIVDDGSQDDSLRVCRLLAKDDPRLQVYSNPTNLGLAATMNCLLKKATGEYLAIQEQDDISLPSRLLLEVDVLNSNPDIGLVSGLAEWIDDAGRKLAYFPGILHHRDQYPQVCSKMVKFLYVEQCKVVNSGCLFRRSVLEKLPYPVFDEDAKMSIDWQFFLHLAHHWKIWGLHEVVVQMNRDVNRQHLTGQKELQFQEARRCIRKIYDIYRDVAESPINFDLFRRAMSTQLVLEGRNYSRGRGMIRLMKSIGYSPLNHSAWSSLYEILRRGFSKAGRLLTS